MSLHGGNIYAIARQTGRSPGRLLDFSASINPLGPSRRAVRAILSGLRFAAHYPDPDCTALREALASRHGLPPEQLLVGNGSSELIALLPRSLSISRGLVIGPTFSEYARAIDLHGGTVIPLLANRHERYRPPLKEAIAVLQRPSAAIDAVFLCNPNSPTGQAVDSDEVAALVDAANRRRAWAVIDETFVEYCEERSVISRVVAFSRMIVLRSFTKFYALPGLRIGYAAGHDDVIRRIGALQPPWSVNTPAQHAALASLRDAPYARRGRSFMARERPRFVNALMTIPGVTVYPSAANFVLVELPPGSQPGEVLHRLREKGVVVRDCSSVPGIATPTIRIAVRTSRENQRLLRALRRAIQ
jgi:threonine-phosphate decarboxylase